MAAGFDQRPDLPQEPADDELGSHTALPELHSTKDAQQEAHPQKTPPHSRWAAVYPDAAQHADSITGSGRKRARHSVSATDSSLAGQDVAVPPYAQHTSPVSASVPQGQRWDAPHHRQLNRHNEEHPGIITEGTVALTHAGALGEMLSPGSSVSDQPASPTPEHSRHAALVAARAVAQVMGLQARHHHDLQVMHNLLPCRSWK